eukprot:sb/3460992/
MSENGSKSRKPSEDAKSNENKSRSRSRSRSERHGPPSNDLTAEKDDNSRNRSKRESSRSMKSNAGENPKEGDRPKSGRSGDPIDSSRRSKRSSSNNGEKTKGDETSQNKGNDNASKRSKRSRPETTSRRSKRSNSKPDRETASRRTKKPSSKPDGETESRRSKKPSSNIDGERSSKRSKRPSSKPGRETASRRSKKPSSILDGENASRRSKKLSSKLDGETESRRSKKPSSKLDGETASRRSKKPNSNIDGERSSKRSKKPSSKRDGETASRRSKKPSSKLEGEEVLARPKRSSSKDNGGNSKNGKRSKRRERSTSKSKETDKPKTDTKIYRSSSRESKKSAEKAGVETTQSSRGSKKRRKRRQSSADSKGKKGRSVRIKHMLGDNRRSGLEWQKEQQDLEKKLQDWLDSPTTSIKDDRMSIEPQPEEGRVLSKDKVSKALKQNPPLSIKSDTSPAHHPEQTSPLSDTFSETREGKSSKSRGKKKKTSKVSSPSLSASPKPIGEPRAVTKIKEEKKREFIRSPDIDYARERRRILHDHTFKLPDETENTLFERFESALQGSEKSMYKEVNTKPAVTAQPSPKNVGRIRDRFEDMNKPKTRAVKPAAVLPEPILEESTQDSGSYKFAYVKSEISTPQLLTDKVPSSSSSSSSSSTDLGKTGTMMKAMKQDFELEDADLSWTQSKVDPVKKVSSSHQRKPSRDEVGKKVAEFENRISKAWKTDDITDKTDHTTTADVTTVPTTTVNFESIMRRDFEPGESDYDLSLRELIPPPPEPQVKPDSPPPPSPEIVEVKIPETIAEIEEVKTPPSPKPIREVTPDIDYMGMMRRDFGVKPTPQKVMFRQDTLDKRGDVSSEEVISDPDDVTDKEDFNLEKLEDNMFDQLASGQGLQHERHAPIDQDAGSDESDNTLQSGVDKLDKILNRHWMTGTQIQLNKLIKKQKSRATRRTTLHEQRGPKQSLEKFVSEELESPMLERNIVQIESMLATEKAWKKVEKMHKDDNKMTPKEYWRAKRFEVLQAYRSQYDDEKPVKYSKLQKIKIKDDRPAVDKFKLLEKDLGRSWTKTGQLDLNNGSDEETYKQTDYKAQREFIKETYRRQKEWTKEDEVEGSDPEMDEKIEVVEKKFVQGDLDEEYLTPPEESTATAGKWQEQRLSSKLYDMRKEAQKDSMLPELKLPSFGFLTEAAAEDGEKDLKIYKKSSSSSESSSSSQDSSSEEDSTSESSSEEESSSAEESSSTESSSSEETSTSEYETDSSLVSSPPPMEQVDYKERSKQINQHANIFATRRSDADWFKSEYGTHLTESPTLDGDYQIHLLDTLRTIRRRWKHTSDEEEEEPEPEPTPPPPPPTPPVIETPTLTEISIEPPVRERTTLL